MRVALTFLSLGMNDFLPYARRLIFSVVVLGITIGCGEERQGSAPPVDILSDAGVLDASASVDAAAVADASIANDAMVIDAHVDALMADAEVDAMAVDAAPEPPSGPIPPPEGTGTTPEGDDFDWNGVGTRQIGRTLPEQNLDWDEYPQYGMAQVLAWSDSEACVCFDIECATCSQDDCSAETCTYDLNESHTLTKYHIELRSMANEDHTITFEVNVSADPVIEYTNLIDILNRLERIPVAYWYGFKIITEFGHGIQFLHSSYFSGAAAYGSRNYIDTDR